MIAFASEKRTYPLPGLGFRDFWDLCSHFQRISPAHDHIAYTLLCKNKALLENQTDVAEILDFLQSDEAAAVDGYLAVLGASPQRGEGSGLFSVPAVAAAEPTEFLYRPKDDPITGQPAGITLSSTALSKLGFYQFETLLRDSYGWEMPHEAAPIRFGRPCEVLACVIDMRGFTVFCEQPNVESPYTCALMSAFYDAVQAGFSVYAPEMTKYLGDGVLCVWETTHQDRAVAVETCLRGLVGLGLRYEQVRRSPQFSHGTPSELGAGVSLGLASRLDFTHDYLGRPINMAARYCSVAEGGNIIVDATLPSIPEDLVRHEHTAHLKSYGRSTVWRLPVEE
jgi:class 3 adenylate cyclase